MLDVSLSVIFYTTYSLHVVKPEPIPADFRHNEGYTPGRSPSHHKDKQLFTPHRQLRESNNLIATSLEETQSREKHRGRPSF